jgi:adenylate kinase family enzyme
MIIITGVPKSGKSTLAVKWAEEKNQQLCRTDDMIEMMEWSEISNEIAKWIEGGDDEIIEGVAAVRGMRKWLKAHPDKQLPNLIFIFLYRPKIELTPGQVSMAKAVITIWEEIREDLQNRKAIILTDAVAKIKTKQVPEKRKPRV